MNKSKFKTFILSLVPGFGHLYLGTPTRGMIFLFSMIGYFFLALFLDGYGYNYNYYGGGFRYQELIFFAMFILWLYSIFDVFKIRRVVAKENPEEYDKALAPENKRIFSILLSIIPGAGHIYLGFQQKGVKLLSTFVLVYLINSILPMQIFSLVLALITLYTIINLHEMNNKNLTSNNQEETREAFTEVFKGSYMKYVGIALILCGTFIIINRIALELIDIQIIREVLLYLREGIIALALIIVGVKLILSNKLRKGE